MNMKRFRMFGILLLSIAMILCGCATSSHYEEAGTTGTPESGATESTGESITADPSQEVAEPSQDTESLEFDEYEIDCQGIPFLTIHYRGGNSGDVYRMVWNLEDSTISEGEYLFNLAGQYDPTEIIWNGDNLFGTPTDASECKDGIACVIISGMIDCYGPCFYDMQTGKLHYFTEKGILCEIPKPDIPERVQEEPITSPPIYVKSLNNGEVLFVYQVYRSWMEEEKQYCEMSLVYGFVPLDQPESAMWNRVDVPTEVILQMDVTENCAAYENGKLYLASAEDILVLDLETEELSYMGIREKMGKLYEGKSTHANEAHFATRHKICGCYEGVLIVQSAMYNAEAKLYQYFLAIKDGEIIGVMERNEEDITTSVYNHDMTEMSQTELITSETAVKFPKDS